MHVSIHPAEPTARRWGQTRACIEIGGASALVLADVAECDALIIAATEAKDLLLAMTPVITDSERDCNEVNPDGSGEHCHKGGVHEEHEDSNGGKWVTVTPHCKHCDPAHCNPMTPGHVTACQTPGCPSVQQLVRAS